jgi:hypothetical protein
MFVRVRWHGRKLVVPLSKLDPLAADPQTKQVVADWHYRVSRGDEF